MIFIFIGGASASGKTSVSERLLTKLREQGTSSQLLSMDDYIRVKPADVPLDFYRLNTNFDTPSIMDFDLLREHILNLSEGKAIVKPKFEFLSCSHIGSDAIDVADVIIIEGIFAQYFAKAQLPEGIDCLSVNVATESYNDIVARRIERNVKDRGQTRDTVIQQERQFVGPGFFRYTAPSASGSDVFIVNKKASREDAFKILDAAVDEIIDALHLKTNTASKTLHS
jgi:uridine kinase